MRRITAGLFAYVLMLLPALAMQQSDAPARFNIPWANSAAAPYIQTIPEASQIGITNCRASLTDGFPPLTFVPASAGGCPPFGKDFNGILKQITQWSRWGSAGGPVFYSSAFSTAIGGYPKGAMLQSAVLVGRVWMSTAENNTTDPDATTAANWVAQPGTAPAGTPIPSLGTVGPVNTVSANGTTIGNAASNATGRANADTYWLFVRIWTDCPNTQCQLFNSGGGAIGRGGSAAADYAANNAIATYNMNGAALMGADNMSGTTSTNLVNVPVVSGSRTVPGSILGENLHTLTIGELATHNHGITDPGHLHTYNEGDNIVAGSSNDGPNAIYHPTASNTGTSTTGITINNAGSSTPHNTVPRSFLTYWWLAL